MDFTVHIFIEEREGVNVATCLEMGLVATADSAEELPGIMEKLISRQFVFALENKNPSDLFHPAEADVWERFRRVTAQQREETTVCKKTEKPLRIRDWDRVGLNQISYAAAAC